MGWIRRPHEFAPRVEDLLQLIPRASAEGLAKAIRDADFGLRCFVFADPDGNRTDVGHDLRAPVQPDLVHDACRHPPASQMART